MSAGAPLPAHETSRPEWPNLFVVGVARAGTSTLWDYLDQHPDIWMSRFKEPYFFSRIQMPLRPLPKEDDVYLALFADAGGARWRGEASTAYFWDEGSAAKIKRASPDARIVISLRDPVERAYSSYWHAVRYGGETRSFDDAVRRELEGGAEPEGAPGYVGAGHYVAGLERYRNLYGPRLHVLFFDDLVARPVETMRTLFSFLDVEADVADELVSIRRNASRAPRNAFFRGLLNAKKARVIARAVVPARLQGQLESLAWASGVPPMTRETRAILEDVYRDERPGLEDFLRRPLPW